MQTRNRFLKITFVHILSFYCLIQTSLFAQNPISVTNFPDIEITDIDGIVHRPYDDLNAGKIVILDFFSTACAPCWEYHEENVLQNIYETFGPQGSNEVAIFLIERELNTTIDEIYDNSFGNYLTCSPYPVINDHEFAFEMGIHEDPTLLFICPDKKITEIGQVPETDLADLISNSCPEPDFSNNLDLLYFTCNLDPTCGETNFIPTVMVQNNGVNTIEHVSLQIKGNGEIISDSVGFDLFIERFETTEIPFNFGEIVSSTDLEISVLTVNHQSDTILSGNTIVDTKPVLQTTENDISVRIATDDFGYEIFWEILDDIGNQVAFGGNELVIPGAQQDVYDLLSSPNYYASSSNYEIPVSLPENGCYTFNIYDDWGDGICCQYGYGKFEIFNAQGEILADYTGFLKEHSVDFVKSNITVSTSENLDSNVEPILFPNPTSGLCSMSYESETQQKIKFTVYNNLGSVVASEYKQVHFGENTLNFDFSSLNTGLYFLVDNHGKMKNKISFHVIKD